MRTTFLQSHSHDKQYYCLYVVHKKDETMHVYLKNEKNKTKKKTTNPQTTTFVLTFSSERGLPDLNICRPRGSTTLSGKAPPTALCSASAYVIRNCTWILVG